jgi:orotate phosphoribosyltransferase
MPTFPSPGEARAIAAQTARMLLEIKAVHFNAANPYIFTSGDRL